MKPAAAFQVRTPHGSVTVYVVKRVYYGPFWFRFNYRGKHVWRSAKTVKLALAKALARRAVTDHVYRSGTGLDSLRLSDAVSRYLAARWPDPGSRNATYQDNANRLKRFARFDPRLDLIGLDERAASLLAQAFLDARRAEGKAPQTLKNDQRVIGRFAVWIMRKGVSWTYNPWHGSRLTLPAVEHTTALSASPLSIQLLLSQARKERNPVFPVLVLVLSGMRRAGACRVRWRDIRDDRRVAPVKEKRAYRVTRLGEWAWNSLAWWKTAQPGPCYDSDLLFPHHPDTASDYVAKLRRTLKLPPALTLASLRRAVEERLDRMRVDPQTSALIMNHSVSTADKHYRQEGTVDVLQAVNALKWG